MRKPIYAKNDSQQRVISVPNGLWQVQKRGNAKGSKTFDPWENVGLAGSLASRLSYLPGGAA